MRIAPQEGPQEAFLSSSADIVIYGGSAGGGKTWALLMEPIRYGPSVSGYAGVIFRRTTVQITNPGGLWDASMELYPHARAKPTAHKQIWSWPGKGYVKFSHLEHEKDKFSWQGTELAFIGMDELTHFTESQFWYLVSRMRSTCGVKPYLRGTCNPDPDSWVADFISWWIDQDENSPRYGLPITERSGVIRWVARINEVLEWAGSKEELYERFPERNVETGDYIVQPKSVTFIPATLADNKAMMRRDPGYLGNLMMLPRVERERLLGGNWKVRAEDSSMFPRDKILVIPSVPWDDIVSWVRKWDLAGTKPSEVNSDPDATASVLMGITKQGKYVIADGTWIREDPHEVRKHVLLTAKQDKKYYKRLRIVLPIDPAQAGKDQFQSYLTLLAPMRVKGVKETGKKEVRAEGFSDQWIGGNVMIVQGSWNAKYLAEMGLFPSGKHDDYTDASVGAFQELTGNLSSIRRFRAMAA